MRTRKAVAALITADIIIAAAILAGCGSYGESHNYNAPPPYANITGNWVRIESSGNYHTIIRACVGKDGIYLTQADNNSVTVVPGDPDCASTP